MQLTRRSRRRPCLARPFPIDTVVTGFLGDPEQIDWPFEPVCDSILGRAKARIGGLVTNT